MATTSEVTAVPYYMIVTTYNPFELSTEKSDPVTTYNF